MKDELQIGEVVERDGKPFVVTSKTPRLSRHKDDGNTTYLGYTYGLVALDNPRHCVAKATELDHLRSALPGLFKLLYQGALKYEDNPELCDQLIDNALADLKKLL